MADLRTDYKDDILDISVNEKRKYRQINNGDGTISLEDVTVYLQVGDNFGANDLNKIAGSAKFVEKTGTLLASNWVGTESPYTNTLAMDGVTETNIVEIVTPSNVTAEEVIAFQSAQILNGTQTLGSITLNAWGEVPGIDLPITIIVRGD